MSPGLSNQSDETPIVSATAIPTTYGTEDVVIDGEITPLVSIVVHDESDDKMGAAPSYRDVPFAVLFAVHAIVMAWLGISVAPKGCDVVNFNVTAIEDEIGQSDDITEKDMEDFEQFISAAVGYIQVYPIRILYYIVVPSCLLAYVIGMAGTTLILKPFPRVAVYASLSCSVVWVAVLMLGSAFASGSGFVFALTGLSLAFAIYYVSTVWKMVPFAAVNLKVALEGIGRNSGMYIVAFLFAELGFCWVMYWFYVFVGTAAYENHECQLAHPGVDFNPDSPNYDDSCEPTTLPILGFLLSFYWTNTIIMNTVQVTVSGVMATWCFDKAEADSCCSRAIYGSVYRSLTYSFGSICFGSLLQAIISVLRSLLESARNRRDRDDNDGCGALLLCVLQCLARLLEDIITYFNQWSYVFVGIYGYSYLESGRRAMELFRARGFTAIITDNLVGYVLAFTTFTVAILTGIAGVLVESSVTKTNADAVKDGESYIFGPLPAPGFAFGLSFVIGLWIVSVMMNVLKGAVNTLIVCWADSPAVMEMQHPTLTKEMAEAWSEVFSTVNFGTPAVIV